VTLQQSDKWKNVCIYVGLIAVTLIAYEPLRHNDFVYFDDHRYVTENPNVLGGITRDSVVWAFTESHAANWHPLTSISHILDCELFGLNALGHHLVNLLLHILTTVLLFYFLSSTTGARWRSAFVAALFALHPIHVESVAWVSERKDVLSGLFWMLTLIAYGYYAKRPGIYRYLLVLLCLCLGLMAKPMVVTLPFVLLLMDYWPLNRVGKTGTGESLQAGQAATGRYRTASWGRLIAEKLPLLVPIVVLSIVTFAVQSSVGAVIGLEELSLPWRIFNGLNSYLQYLIKMAYPIGLVVLYPQPEKQHIDAGLLLVAIVAAVMLVWARNRRWLTVGLCWYFGTLVPVIGFVQVGLQAMADRYTYLPSVGIFVVIAWAGAEVVDKLRVHKAAVATAISVVLIVLTGLTRMQVGYWRNTPALFERAATATKNNFAMHNLYGFALLDNGHTEDAILQFRRALEINPEYINAKRHLGDALLKLGNVEEAVRWYSKALEQKRDWVELHNDLGLVYVAMGKDELAAEHFRAALHYRMNYVNAMNNLAIVLQKQGRPDEALEQLHQSLEIDANQAHTAAGIGTILMQQGKAEQAVTYFERAVALSPSNYLLLEQLAAAYQSTGKTQQAEQARKRAAQLKSAVGSSPAQMTGQPQIQ